MSRALLQYPKLRKWFARHERLVIGFSTVIIFALLGTALLVFTKAATNQASFEAESGQESIALEQQVPGASGGRAVKFGKATPTDLGGVVINTTLGARPAQYSNDSEAVVTQNLDNRGNYDASSGGYNTPNGQGQFRFYCQFSHLNYDDPIVYPPINGVPQVGKAHLHMFWGNTKANASTTDSSLVNSGGGTCAGYEANRTGYWMPAVQDANDKVVIPNDILMYYKSAANLNAQTKIMPQGLKMIAGKATGNTDPSLMNENGIQWQCYTGSLVYTYEGQTIPDSCPPNPNQATNCDPNVCDKYDIKLMAVIYFQPCVAVHANGSPVLDSTQLDQNPSTNHKDHLSYFTSVNGKLACPPSHPYIMPQVSYHVSWPGNLNYSGWHLSSDRMANVPDGSSLHGDWYGGWNNQIMEHWTKGCINKGQNCSNGVLGTDGSYPMKRLKSLGSDYSGPNPVAKP